MNITFHVMIGLTETVFLGKTMKEPASDKLYHKGDWIQLASGFIGGVLTHGLVDWLYHRYPIPFVADFFIAGILWLAIPFFLKKRWWLIYGFTSLGNVFPDLVDHGIQAINYLFDSGMRQITLFPWHYREISSALLHEYPVTSPILYIIVIILFLVSLWIGYRFMFRNSLRKWISDLSDSGSE